MPVMKYKSVLSSMLEPFHQGKTRDTFVTQWPDGGQREPPLLVVASKRISTHNVVHENWISGKGEVLTALTIFWLKLLEARGIRTHLLASGQEIYRYLPRKRSDYPADLHYRAIIVKRLQMIPVEFIYRAYLCGSLWNDYYSKGLPDPYGLNLPASLSLMQELAWEGIPRSVFTPTEKSETDSPLPSVATALAHPLAERVGREVFHIGRTYLRARGLELVDTKFEFGVSAGGEILLADEVMTPDSSRLARLADIKTGETPPWLDKQVARDEAEKLWAGGPKKPLIFDQPIVKLLTETYLELFEQVTGMSLKQFQRERLN